MVLKQFKWLYVGKFVLDPYKLTWFSNGCTSGSSAAGVLDPYKLTWFSNSSTWATSTTSSFRSLQTYMVLKHWRQVRQQKVVLDPYKLTWFSNTEATTIASEIVLDPYKLTWFSNVKFKNFAVLTELLHTDICCKPIFLIPHVYFTT